MPLAVFELGGVVQPVVRSLYRLRYVTGEIGSVKSLACTLLCQLRYVARVLAGHLNVTLWKGLRCHVSMMLVIGRISQST